MTPPWWRSPATLFVLGCIAAAVCVDFSRYHERQHADSLIPILCSLYQWTPFYWGQDRLGMILPAVAAPVKDPFANLLVQNGIAIAACLGWMGLSSWYLLRDRSWCIVGGMSVVILLVKFPEGERFHLFNGSQPYPLAMLGAVGAILLAAGRGRMLLRLAIASLLTAAAYWYNSGVGVIVAPLAFLRLVTSFREAGSRREFVAATLFTAAGTLFGRLLMKYASSYASQLDFAPADTWPSAWATLAESVWARFDDYILKVSSLGLFGVLWACGRESRAAAVRAWKAVFVVVTWLVVQWLAFGTMEWVQKNDNDIRYLFMGILAVIPAFAATAFAPLASFIERDRMFAVLMMAAMPLAAVVAYGPPSLSAARAGVEQSCGLWTADLQTARCTHIVGEYWDVWPAMFHLNMVQPQEPPVWGVAFRAECCEFRWKPAADEPFRLGFLKRFAGAVYAADAVFHWKPAFPQTAVAEERRTVTVLVPR
jgi:hypothetical protein